MQKVLDSQSSKNREHRNRMHELCRQFNRAPSKGHLKKLKHAFHFCGEEVFIEHGFNCDYGDKISIGNRVFINFNCTLLDGGRITISDDVLIAPNVQILTVNHPLTPQERLQKTNLIQDVFIGNNVWIGAGTIILPGVIISDNVVVGAGSVVTKDLDEGCLYVGNPAKKIRGSL